MPRLSRPLLAAALVASPLPTLAQPATGQGPTFGLAVGVSRISLGAVGTRPAIRATDLSIGWHVGWQTSSRVALLLAGTSAIYPAPVGAGHRKRGFELLTPMIEYWVADGFRLQAGAGLQLDAPVFWDSRPLEPGGPRFSHGLGLIAGASYALRQRGPIAPEVRVRWNAGYVDLPAGREHGQHAAVLLGVRRNSRR